MPSGFIVAQTAPLQRNADRVCASDLPGRLERFSASAFTARGAQRASRSKDYYKPQRHGLAAPEAFEPSGVFNHASNSRMTQ
jgi:hypothetical protein